MEKKNNSGTGVGKHLLVATCKFIGIVLAFLFQVAGRVLVSIGQLIQKLSGYDTHH